MDERKKKKRRVCTRKYIESWCKKKTCPARHKTQTCSISKLTSNPTRFFKCQNLSRSRVDIPGCTLGAARQSLTEAPSTTTLRIAGIAAAGSAADVASESNPTGPSRSHRSVDGLNNKWRMFDTIKEKYRDRQRDRQVDRDSRKKERDVRAERTRRDCGGRGEGHRRVVPRYSPPPPQPQDVSTSTRRHLHANQNNKNGANPGGGYSRKWDHFRSSTSPM